MKFNVILATCLLFLTSQSFGESIDDLFNQGEKVFFVEKDDAKNIALKIEKDAQIACQPNGQCVLSSIENNQKAWEISFNVGQGGGYTNSGTTIITGGYDPVNSSCQQSHCLPSHWGLTLTRRNTKCSQKILVPRSLYISMNRYLYGLLQDNGEPRKGFTPADETMIIFYSTIMKQASNVNCNGK